jgi:hypothetical protein
MRGEPHRITTPLPEPYTPPAWFVRDLDDVLHIARTYHNQYLGRDNNIIEEDVECTDCDVEVCAAWTRLYSDGTRVPTCLECASK